jgi:hypothetical protein
VDIFLEALWVIDFQERDIRVQSLNDDIADILWVLYTILKLAITTLYEQIQ